MTTVLHLPATPDAPIACDMSTARDTPDERLAEYGALFERALLRRERRADAVVFWFRGDAGTREHVDDLARREQRAARSWSTASRRSATKWSGPRATRSRATNAPASTSSSTRSTTCRHAPSYVTEPYAVAPALRGRSAIPPPAPSPASGPPRPTPRPAQPPTLPGRPWDRLPQTRPEPVAARHAPAARAAPGRPRPAAGRRAAARPRGRSPRRARTRSAGPRLGRRPRVDPSAARC